MSNDKSEITPASPGPKSQTTDLNPAPSTPVITPTETPMPEETSKAAKKSEKPTQAPQESQPTPEPKKEKNGKKKDEAAESMKELLESYQQFVDKVNGKLSDIVKKMGEDTWKSFKETKPMKTLAGALKEGKEYIKDNVDAKIDSVKGSAPVTAAKAFMTASKDKISGAWDKVSNAAADAIASAVRKATSSGPELTQPGNSPSTSTQAQAAQSMAGVPEVQSPSSSQSPSTTPQPSSADTPKAP